MSEKESVKRSEQPITKKDMDEWTKAIADMIGELSSRLPELKPKQESEEGKAPYCPECGVYVKDVFAHLKKEPEKHGLVKTVEVVKEVPVTKKRTVKDMLAEHDFFDCPECRKDIDEHLSKKGMKISRTEEETEREESLFGL